MGNFLLQFLLLLACSSQVLRLETESAVKMLCWEHERVLQPLTGISAVYGAKPALSAAEAGSFTSAVFRCNVKKASAIAEAFDKRSCISSTDINILKDRGKWLPRFLKLS